MELDTEAIRREKADIVARYGEWTAHNIHLVGDVYTIQSGVTGDEFRLRRVMQIIDDVAGSRPPQDLRVLDLACLEGMYSVELARKGATVVAIEGREANIAKAAFARRVLRLDTMELIRDVCAICLASNTASSTSSSAWESSTTSTLRRLQFPGARCPSVFRFRYYRNSHEHCCRRTSDA